MGKLSDRFMLPKTGHSVLAAILGRFFLDDHHEPKATPVRSRRVARPSIDSKPPTPKWGRKANASSVDSLHATLIMTFCPLITLICYSSLNYFDGSIPSSMLSLAGSLYRPIANSTGINVLDWIMEYFPKPTIRGFAIYGAWVLFQSVLFIYLPGKVTRGQITPAGHLLNYKVNGLLAWFLSNSLFILGGISGWWSLSVVAENWGGLLVAANVYGYTLTFLVYAKARLAPSHSRDSKFSGSFFYDLYMGVELNPRITDAFDFKLFHNGRPGIIAWTIINISFTNKQYERFGSISYGTFVVNVLQAIYVIDFFFNEDWYLRTIDIAHDHFGFYLAWGDSVWLPQMYTLQCQYLSIRRNNLPWLYTTAILVIGLGGYGLFRTVNHHKDIVRRTDGKSMIWGQPAKVIRANYRSLDDKPHQSLLLYSGWWGIVRHANYLGDLIQAFAMCAGCASTQLLPYSYLIFMVILLVHRSSRDNIRCSEKYGEYWEEYKRLVKWHLIPYIY